MRPLLRLSGLATLVFLCAPARADRIHLADGRILEGLAEEVEGAVRLHRRKGWFDLPKADVVRIEKAPAPWEEYDRKAARLEASDAKGHLALAAWCRERNLSEEMLKEYGSALKADPGCVEAQEALDRAKPPEPEAKEASKPPPERKAEAPEPARPLEGLFGPYEPGSPPEPARARGGAWGGGIYPVNPGSIWYFPWGTVYGPPRVIYGGTWAGSCEPCPSPYPTPGLSLTLDGVGIR